MSAITHSTSNWPIYASAIVAVAGLATMATLTIIAIRGPGLSSMNHISLGLSIGGCYLFILFTLTSVFLYRNKKRNEKLAAIEKEKVFQKIIKENKPLFDRLKRQCAAIKIQGIFRKTYDRNTLIAQYRKNNPDAPALKIEAIKTKEQLQELEKQFNQWRIYALANNRNRNLSDDEQISLLLAPNFCNRILSAAEELSKDDKFVYIIKDSSGIIHAAMSSTTVHKRSVIDIPYILSNPDKRVKEKGAAPALIGHAAFLSRAMKREKTEKILSEEEREKQRTGVTLYPVGPAKNFYPHIGFKEDRFGGGSDLILQGAGLRKCLRKYGGIATAE